MICNTVFGSGRRELAHFLNTNVTFAFLNKAHRRKPNTTRRTYIRGRHRTSSRTRVSTSKARSDTSIPWRIMQRTNIFLARGIHRNNKAKHLWGAPGVPVIKTSSPKVTPKFRSTDLLVKYTWCDHRSDRRLLHYLGKHVPHAQKNLWSADTPVLQDKHLFKLTTIDVDMFKFWFGVKRARLSNCAWKIIYRSSLLPPPFSNASQTPIPKPIFDKEQLYKYFLANRKPLEVVQKEDYRLYKNGMAKTDAQRASERPRAPYL